MSEEVLNKDLNTKIDEFVQSWGRVATSWGISKTMGQIHGLLLVSPRPLTSDDFIERLSISRGNAHLNLQNLLQIELIYKAEVEGARKDYFRAEKDIWTLMLKVVKFRKSKELDPMISLVDEYANVEVDSVEGEEFKNILSEISMFGQRAEFFLDTLTHQDHSWVFNSFDLLHPKR